MVQAGTDEVELRLVVDRAEVEKILGGSFSADAKTKAPGGGGKSPRGGTTVSPSPSFMSIFKPLAALSIIKFGINTMVKNSKVMSTTMGAFGAIMGAILDIILIAFMPIIVKILKKLVDMLPMIQEWVNKWAPIITEKLVEIWEAVKLYWELYGPQIIAWGKQMWDTTVEWLPKIWNSTVTAFGYLKSIANWIAKLVRFFTGADALGIASLPEKIMESKPFVAADKAMAQGEKTLEKIGLGGILGTSATDRLRDRGMTASGEKVSHIGGRDNTQTARSLEILASMDQSLRKIRDEQGNLRFAPGEVVRVDVTVAGGEFSVNADKAATQTQQGGIGP